MIGFLLLSRLVVPIPLLGGFILQSRLPRFVLSPSPLLLHSIVYSILRVSVRVTFFTFSIRLSRPSPSPSFLSRDSFRSFRRTFCHFYSRFRPVPRDRSLSLSPCCPLLSFISISPYPLSPLLTPLCHSSPLSP